ncbi:MAG: hypothetical protein K2H64_03285, partial [Desulfovibrio sp.]|nr:hypothetical protein [Desulfovibrio sp.]
EFFEELLAALSGGDCAKTVELARQFLKSGADIGFFIKELASRLRSLFLFGQAGDKILPALSLPPDEVAFLKKTTPLFDVRRSHASWQMTLENQRSVSQNPDPGSALELLLVNLALLPQLLPIGDSRASGPVAAPPRHGEPSKISPRTAASPARPETEPAGGSPEEVVDEGSARDLSWDGFREFCELESKEGRSAPPRELLCQLKADWNGDKLELRSRANFLWDKLQACMPSLRENLKKYCGGDPPEIQAVSPRPALSREELKNMAIQDPEIQLVERTLGATVVECQPKTTE